MVKAPRVLGIVLAGGEGKRLMPLTADRAKPAVPFGGSYRLGGFVLCKLFKAGHRNLFGLTQIKLSPLDRHRTRTLRMLTPLGRFFVPLHATQPISTRTY